jgi:very-short-patch-repair endonuclease
MILRQKIATEIGELFEMQADISWFMAEEFTESPIETAFVVAFEWFCHYYWDQVVINKRPADTRDFSHLWQRFGSEGWVHVNPQAEIGDYRVDFLITFSCYDREEAFIVECDGHNFHDRTPEQASRDRERDRKLTIAGHKVFRFTGTDINRRPMDCVNELMQFITTRRVAARRASENASTEQSNVVSI